MKRFGILICLIVAVVLAWHPGMTWAQSGQQGAPALKIRDDGNAITLQTLADGIKARLQAVQPAVVEREWAQYRSQREAYNMIRSPLNPETDLEFMLRSFW